MHALSRRDARGVLRRGRHPRGTGRRRRWQLRLRQQDERGEAAPGLGRAAAAARPGLRRRRRGRQRSSSCSTRRAARELAPARGPAPGSRDRLGVSLSTAPRPVGAGLADLVGLAVRRNPRRAHLLVSRGAGQARPDRSAARVRARRCCSASSCARDLRGDGASGRPVAGRAVAARPRRRRRGGSARPAACAAAGPWTPSVVLGYAETATALGHAVADALGDASTCTPPAAPCRACARTAASRRSTATPPSHLLLPADPAAAGPRRPAGAGGRRALHRPHRRCNTIAALHAVRPREPLRRRRPGRPARTPRTGPRMAALAAELGARIDVGRPRRRARVEPARRTSWRRASRLVAATPESDGPPPPPGRRARGARCRGSTWAGRAGCPTAGGTASCPPTGTRWRRTCRRMAGRLAERAGARPARPRAGARASRS